MSDWEDDDVAGNTWSSIEEVAWIESENKVEHIVSRSGPRKSSSCTSAESFQRGIIETSSGNKRRLPDENYQRFVTSPKSENLEDHSTQESGYNGNDKANLSRKGDWYDYTPGSSLTTLSLDNLGKPGSVLRGVHEVEGKKGATRYSLAGVEMCKVNSSYNEDGADMVNSSCHFLPSDMCLPGGDLEFLTEVQEEVRQDNLLEFGWGNTNNLEDMDILFSSADSILPRGFDNNTGMFWESPSPTLGDSIESLRQPDTMPASPEFVKTEVANGFDTKTELVISKGLLKQETNPVSEEWRSSSDGKQHVSPKQQVVPVNDSCIPMQVDSCTNCSNGSNGESQRATAKRNKGSECVNNESVHAQKETFKRILQRSKRQQLPRFPSSQLEALIPGEKAEDSGSCVTTDKHITPSMAVIQAEKVASSPPLQNKVFFSKQIPNAMVKDNFSNVKIPVLNFNGAKDKTDTDSCSTTSVAVIESLDTTCSTDKPLEMDIPPNTTLFQSTTFLLEQVIGRVLS
ncbi:hypothetical protein L7F22_011210 [Adiantum nelumboides]|nr:hypothetical protein [Adiantum nelumboides]